MDEAFIPFSRMLEQMMTFGGECVDEEARIRMYIRSCEIDSPIELDVSRDADGALVIGMTPPLYCLQTTISPSFHRVKFLAKLSGEVDD
jgi:hypothetical protein